MLTGHNKKVRSVAFTPDGKQLLSGGEDNLARLWDVKTGDQIRVFTGHAKAIYWVAISPDGKLAAAASWDKFAKVWDLQTGKGIGSLGPHPDKVTTLVFLPNGRELITGCADNGVRLWDVQRGVMLNHFAGQYWACVRRGGFARGHPVSLRERGQDHPPLGRGGAAAITHLPRSQKWRHRCFFFPRRPLVRVQQRRSDGCGLWGVPAPSVYDPAPAPRGNRPPAPPQQSQPKPFSPSPKPRKCAAATAMKGQSKQ